MYSKFLLSFAILNNRSLHTWYGKDILFLSEYYLRMSDIAFLCFYQRVIMSELKLDRFAIQRHFRMGWFYVTFNISEAIEHVMFQPYSNTHFQSDKVRLDIIHPVQKSFRFLFI